MSSNSRVIGYGSALLLVLVGIAAGIIVGGTAGGVLALVLVGFGFVLAVGLIFYEVGLSEDRERAREKALQQRKAGAPRRSRPRGRLERRRGQRRRLD